MATRNLKVLSRERRLNLNVRIGNIAVFQGRRNHVIERYVERPVSFKTSVNVETDSVEFAALAKYGEGVVTFLPTPRYQTKLLLSKDDSDVMLPTETCMIHSRAGRLSSDPESWPILTTGRQRSLTRDSTSSWDFINAEDFHDFAMKHSEWEIIEPHTEFQEDVPQVAVEDIPKPTWSELVRSSRPAEAPFARISPQITVHQRYKRHPKLPVDDIMENEVIEGRGGAAACRVVGEAYAEGMKDAVVKRRALVIPRMRPQQIYVREKRMAAKTASKNVSQENQWSG